jgi:hypothetical protein
VRAIPENRNHGHVSEHSEGRRCHPVIALPVVTFSGVPDAPNVWSRRRQRTTRSVLFSSD